MNAKDRDDLKRLITRAMGEEEAQRAAAFEVSDVNVLSETAQELMRMLEPTPGACVMMSAAWAQHLRTAYNIPAVAVAGDLKIAGRWAFRMNRPLPDFKPGHGAIRMSWKGHCWMEIGGWICDVSIFRTAYSMSMASPTRQYIEKTFGLGRGACLIRADQLPEGLKYRRQAVLTLNQLIGFTESLGHLIEHGPDVFH